MRSTVVGAGDDETGAEVAGELLDGGDCEGSPPLEEHAAAARTKTHVIAQNVSLPSVTGMRPSYHAK